VSDPTSTDDAVDPEAERPLIEYGSWVADESFNRHAGYAVMNVYAGPRAPGRWARHVQVTVSPTGRSARVWVDGVEIPIRKDGDGG
jgi:hypothetical protein